MNSKRNIALFLFTALFVLFKSSALFPQDLSEVYSLISSSAYHEAVKNLDELLKTDRMNPRLNSLKGKIYFLLADEADNQVNQVEYKRQADIFYRKALKNDENNTNILNEYGELKAAQGYYSEAERIFNRVIKLDNMNITAFSNLCKLKEEEPWEMKKYEKSFLELDKKFNTAETKVCLYTVYSGMKEWKKGRDKLLEALEIDSSRADLYKRLSDVSYQLEEYGGFTKYYYLYLKKVNDYKIINQLYYDTMDILSDLQKKEFLSLNYSERGGYLLDFWKGKDPNPITEENERLKEHFRRLEHARTFYFSYLGKTGYGDRGRWYVKLGPPDETYEEPMGGSINVGGRMVITPANESWSYSSIDPNLTFDFMVKAIKSSSVMQTTSSFSLRQVDHLGQYVGEGIAKMMYQERTHMGMNFLSLAYSTDYRSAAMNVTNQRRNALIRAEEKIDFYKPEFSFDKNLYFGLDICQFKGENDSTLVETYYGVYNGQFKAVLDTATDNFVLDFTADFLAQDSSLNEIYRTSVKTSSGFWTKEELRTSVSIDKKTIKMNPGKNRLYVQLLEGRNNKGGLLNADLEIRDFCFDTLMISDIMFAEKITAEDKISKFRKRDLNIVPHPFKEIGKDKKIYTFFEIYNLSFNSIGKTEYEISYTVRKKQGDSIIDVVKKLGRIFTRDKKWLISSTFLRKGDTKDPVEYLMFDFSTLGKGEYILSISVNDKELNTQAAIEKEFKIIN